METGEINVFDPEKIMNGARCVNAGLDRMMPANTAKRRCRSDILQQQAHWTGSGPRLQSHPEEFDALWRRQRRGAWRRKEQVLMLIVMTAVHF